MKQRIITAIIALIILVPLIIYGDLPFIVMTYLLASVGLYELTRMYNVNKGIMYLVLSLPFLWLLLYPYTLFMSSIKVVLLFAIILFILSVLLKNKFTFQDGSFLFMATFYLGIAFFFLIEVRLLGLNYFLFVLFLIWATDTGAYFVGKSLGKRKLWPEISPNKTIAGALGGIIIAIIVALVFQVVYPFDLSYSMIILIAIVISVFGQIGDLVASAMKRQYDIKDFGKLFPGHGGVLDRLDSLLFVMLLLYLLPLF
ncbi:MAG TPA: phosphatidate cytidylyltransferase [Pseudogracilibacillus sp.]|nr:phosphatidate cytidylyltransferase [Pseudogracilibacillus sp.]